MKKTPWLTVGAIGLVFIMISCAYGLGGKLSDLKHQYQSLDVKVEKNRMTDVEQTLILKQIKDSLHILDKSLAEHTLLLDALKERN